MLKNKLLLLILIFLFAGFLRVYDINSNPKAMYGDEMTMVYDAYSISLTGYDQKGERLPLVFQLGGARPPGYVYATVPFARIFGPTAFAARVVSILSGLGIIFLLYLLTKKFFDKNTALLAAFLGSISPWAVSLSRAGFESNLALFLALLGIYAFLRGKNQLYWFIISALSFGLSIQTYPTYRLVIPLTLFSFCCFYIKEIKSFLQRRSRSMVIISVLIFLFSCVLSVYLTFSLGDRDRFSTINIFQDQSSQVVISGQIGLQRDASALSKPVSSIFHNKIIELGGLYVKNYLDNLSWEFLFIGGDSNPRHNPAGMGQLLWITPVLLVFALKKLVKTEKQLLFSLIGWIIITPVAAATVGASHALRTSFMLPPFIILSAVGLSQILTSYPLSFFKKKSYLSIVLASLLIIQVVFFIERLFFISPNLYSNFWSYSAKAAAEIVQKDKNQFQFVVLSNDIADMEYAYPVYSKIDPLQVIEQNKQKTKIGDYSFFKYDNVYIGSLPKSNTLIFLNSLPGSVLYIGTSEVKNIFESQQANGQFKIINTEQGLLRAEKYQ